jgi:hypothetical protein
MQQTDQLSRQVDWLLARGFDPVRAQRLTFVRWSLLEGYAQFSEFITSLRHVSPKHERRQRPQSHIVGPLGTAS